MAASASGSRVEHEDSDLSPESGPDQASAPGGALTDVTKPEEKKRTKELLQTLKELTNEELYQSAVFLEDHCDPSEANKLLMNLTKEIQTLKEQLRSKADVRAPKVKAFCVVAGRTFGAEEQVLQKINAEVCEEPGQSDVVMVFCPICTRAEADVADATRRVPAEVEETPVILVKMYHTRDRQHGVPSSERNHDDITLSVSVLYHETESGLLECSSNDEALKEIREETRRICRSKGLAPDAFSLATIRSFLNPIIFCGRNW